MKYLLFYAALLSTCLLQTIAGAQTTDWKWNWGAPPDPLTNGPKRVSLLCTDRANNIYSAYVYSDTLRLHDTTFYHGPGYFGENCIIAKYGYNGRFGGAIDIYTSAYGDILNTTMVTDTSGNIYIACEFLERAYVMDSVILNEPGYSQDIPEIFIVKLGPDLDIKWMRRIYGTSQANIDGLTITGDQHLFIATSHYGNGYGTESAGFFSQDATTFSSTLQSILKMDLEGNMIWRREIRGESPMVQARKFFLGEDGLLYHLSLTSCKYAIGSDTIPMPDSPYNYEIPCLLSFHQDGTFRKGNMLNFGLWINDMETTGEGDLFFSGVYYDTLYLGSDTLVMTGDTVGYILGRMNDDFQPYWYQELKTTTFLGYPIFMLQPSGDFLYFTVTIKGNFQFCGQSFSMGSNYKAMVGMMDGSGDLQQSVMAGSGYEMMTFDLMSDNCDNIVISGNFRGLAWFGPDTLWGGGAQYCNYIGYLEVQAPLDPGLQNDTTVCGKMILRASPGFSYYSWNGGAPGSDSLEVTQTGWYAVTVHNENYCWAEDSVFVTIIDFPDQFLGNDTSIYLETDLSLEIPFTFDHCLWSTGDTTATIILHGSDLGTGMHTVSVMIEKGPCMVYDSIRITVSKNPGVDELGSQRIYFYPNPAGDKIMVRLPAGAYELTISDMKGTGIILTRSRNTSEGYREVSVGSLVPGVYTLKVKTEEQVLFGKVVKR